MPPPLPGFRRTISRGFIVAQVVRTALVVFFFVRSSRQQMLLVLRCEPQPHAWMCFRW